MSMIDTLPRSRSYSTIRVDSDCTDDSHWLYMHAGQQPGTRPCFQSQMLDDVLAALGALTSQELQQRRHSLKHLVIASDANVFNLGGDLALFSDLIRRQDRNQLLSYAHRCVSGVHQLHRGLAGDVRTIALVQGDALGGGLEIALACHTIVAEEGITMGLPEVIFGLFPGMGAYSFLCKRMPPQLAEKIILEGNLYSSEQMHALGIVDVLVPKGQGRAAVKDLIRDQRRNQHSYLAMNAARNLAQPVTLQELQAITEVWVDSALALDEKSLRTMDRLVRAQTRRLQDVAA
ncbi:crotonase/enoyl-CoA hydratase family protein [Xanthomonas sp. CFBP 8703]|uniref:Crotonase/enoyl-CoA hydratase family protein n=1 Tax=Xanthomonas bonasiae TaxID=2810351 RepID=A0ABS3AZZ7_9XANT|nr:crotonase/enoyl-CoA hydratase family protein [Xanthomonas bonasiae]MBN6101658.1 crotonase/enoyl-CoA hydratase family protein [Xanthomonas bonasiae]